MGESEEKGSQEDQDQQKSQAAAFRRRPPSAESWGNPEDRDNGENQRRNEEKCDQLIMSEIESQQLAFASWTGQKIA